MIRTDAGPKHSHASITPNDSTFLTKDATARTGNLYRALFVGGAGNIALEDRNGVVVTYAVPAGQIIPFSPRKVMATNTTATLIVGWSDA